ncbi:MAG: hypothetical protein IKW03_02400 [Clostridia bacterium]|nr:hypothetical protein [Clostridia bacterium]
MKKKFLKIVSFVLVFALTITAYMSALDFKYLDSVFKFDAFYELPENSVDVLVLGSSHAYQGINTAVMWREYGYSAFNLCGAAQPLWNTYYYLEEALKTQTPKVIILDIYYMHYSSEYSESSFAIKNTYGMKWSDNKKEAIEVSFDHTTTGIQYYIEALQYHSRYSDLNKTDFYPYQANKDMYENHKGFYCYFRSEALKERDLSGVKYYNEVTDKTMFYYRMILELAKSKGIPVIVTAIPFDAENYHQGIFNTVEAATVGVYDVAFINFLTDYKAAAGIDYSKDFADKQHLNFMGNTKITRFLGDYIKAHYDVPDNRGNEYYESWDKDAQVYYNQLENYQATHKQNITDYVSVVSNPRYTTVVTLATADTKKLSICKPLLNLIAPEFKGKTGVWIIENNEIVYFREGLEHGFSKSYTLGRTDGVLVKSVDKVFEDGTPITVNEVYFNKQKKSSIDHGVNILVYDNFTQSIVDAVYIDFDTGKFKR